MEKVRILAFDPGTANMGYAVLEGNIKENWLRLEGGGVIGTTKAHGDIRERVDRLGELVVGNIEAAKPSHIVIEDFIEQGVKSGTTYRDMSILIEHMRMLCRFEGFEATIYTNAEWKVLASGVRGLNKKQVQHLVKHNIEGTERLGDRQIDTHIWDCAGIGYAKFKELQGA